jgi:hypothetical protein
MGFREPEMSKSVEDVIGQLEQNRQDLLDLSEDIWRNADPHDPDERRAVIEFMESFDNAIDDLAELSDDIEGFFREYTQSDRNGAETIEGNDTWEPPDDESVEHRALDADNFTNTKPAALRTDAFLVRGVGHWSDLLRELLDHLADTHPEDFDELTDHERFESSRGRRYFADSPDPLRSAERFGDGVYAELNLSSNDIAERLSELLDFFGYDADSAIVRVER